MVRLDEETDSLRSQFGRELRRAREDAEIELSNIVAATKVSKSVFHAMEDGSFDRLPERVFCRSFAAQYIRAVRGDESRLLELFDRAWAEHESVHDSRSDLIAIDAGLQRSIHWRFWIPVWVGCLIVAVAAIAILSGDESMTDELARDPRRSGVASVVETPALLRPTAAVTPSRSPAVDPELEEEATIDLVISVHPEEECWLNYRDRNGDTAEHLLAGGQRLPLQLPGPVKLTIGNAGAVEIQLGGRTISDLGVSGQVVHAEVTRDGLSLHGLRDLEAP